MNKLTQYLVQDLLEIEDKPQIAIFGGNFSPATYGHFSVVKKALEQNPNINKFYIYVGSSTRDGITQEQSVKIWNIYEKYLPVKVEVIPVGSPITAIYDYAKAHPEEKILWILGAREGNSKDVEDAKIRTKSAVKYPNLTPQVITTQGDVSGTKARQALTVSQEEFTKFIPNEVKEKDEIYYILKPEMKEDKIPGGLAQGKTLGDIAKHHNYPYQNILILQNQLQKGISVEMEHTEDSKIAKEIALDHLWEDPNYYDKLEKIEKPKLKENKDNSDYKKYLSYINEVLTYCCNDLQIERPKVIIINDDKYTQENHSFGGYVPGENKIYLVIKNRNCSDSCRTLSHEIRHMKQDVDGVLTNESGKDGSQHENECNAYAGKIMREFNRKHPEILTLINV